MSICSLLLALHLPLSLASAVPQCRDVGAKSFWKSNHFKSLVTFGDSLTDGGRTEAIFASGELFLEPGTEVPQSTTTTTGGRSWTSYVTQYVDEMGDGPLGLYNYAVWGAVCNSTITPIEYEGVPFRMVGVIDYEIPSFVADLTATVPGTERPFFDPPLDPKSTVYTVWIGNNDVGKDGFLEAGQAPGFTISDCIDCVYDSFDALYKLGARNFVMGTLLPLELTPLYANETLNGLESPLLWPEKSELNSTILANNILSLTNTINTVFKYRTPYELKLAARYPDANFAVFDGNSFIRHVYLHPQDYFNGTLPANVQVPAAECTFGDTGVTTCTLAGDAVDSPDSFMWYDDIHATEQTHRVLAREFVKVLNGESKYTEYYAAKP